MKTLQVPDQSPGSRQLPPGAAEGAEDAQQQVYSRGVVHPLPGAPPAGAGHIRLLPEFLPLLPSSPARCEVALVTANIPSKNSEGEGGGGLWAPHL